MLRHRQLRALLRLTATLGALASACAGGGAAVSPPPVQQEPFEDPGDASGHADMSEMVVFGFSHNSTSQSDPQVYERLVPDMAIRGWLAGFKENPPAWQYTTDFLRRSHDAGVVFMGGLTGSAVFREDAASDAEFLDWITRDAFGDPVPHPELGAWGQLYRGSIANPRYRERLLATMRTQIDLGADGIVVDEADGMHNGGQKWGWNGNEGYDDYYLVDFNRYLLEKYPALDTAGWMSTFGMTAGNVLRRDVPADDLARNFNYRTYLREHGWAADPHTPANPLAREWGRNVDNRPTLADSSFREKATRLYWKKMVRSIRQYARERYGKEIVVTANGIFPYVDFNELGMYDLNQDDEGREARYVPVTADGHLDGARSLLPVFRQLYARNREVAGDVPLIVFIDWPCPMMDRYLALPASEKMDLWQLYLPEALAAGIYYAFHLKTSDPSYPTATQSGVIDFMARYAEFYKAHRDLFTHVVPAPERTVAVSVAGVASAVTEQPSRNRWLVHLVNHDYDGAIVPQGPFTVSIEAPVDPASITLVTPDGADQHPTFTRDGASLRVAVGGLRYYDVLVVAWP